METFPVKEFDVFVPITYNDGSPIPNRTIERIGERLLEHFDGMTFFPQENEGFWKMGDVTYRDKIVIFRVIADKVRSARRYLVKLKEQLKLELDQEEILIIERDIETL
jgi:hypothetical protein